MRWMRFTKDAKTQYGIVTDDGRINAVDGDPFDGYSKTDTHLAMSDVTVELPVVPTTFYAVGFNYPEHVRKVAAQTGREPNLPTQPDVGYRANNSLTAHNQPIIIPHDATDLVEYEGELVAVIGKRCRFVSEADALSYVLGYTIGNDVSERSWQKSDKTLWRAKNPDTFAPMGPWIETDVDLDALETTVRVNGEHQITFKTNAMLFGVATFISKISQYCTMEPGDVLWMGTDGHGPGLKDGDVVDVEISGIGTLTNPVKRAAAPTAN